MRFSDIKSTLREDTGGKVNKGAPSPASDRQQEEGDTPTDAADANTWLDEPQAIIAGDQEFAIMNEVNLEHAENVNMLASSPSESKKTVASEELEDEDARGNPADDEPKVSWDFNWDA